MMRTNLQRAVRVVRRRLGMRQCDLGERAGVSREVVSRLERGELRGMTLASIDRVAEALAATVDVTLRWQGEQVDRMLDAAHAALQKSVAETLTSLGWLVQVEVSFNRYGDRGRVDVIALHPMLRIVVVVEVKSALGDLQDTLGRLDIKARVARAIAAEIGWSAVSGVVPMLVIGQSRATRRVVAEHEPLFARYSVRGRSCVAWLRRPTTPVPSGLLWFVKPPDSHHVTIRSGQRVRTAQTRACCTRGVNPDRSRCGPLRNAHVV